MSERQRSHRRAFLQSLAGLVATPAALTSTPGYAAAANPQRVDVHHHIIPKEFILGLRKTGLSSAGGVNLSGKPQPGVVDLPDWSPELSLGLMDRHGIQTAITSVSSPGVYFGDRKLAVASGPRYQRSIRAFARRPPGSFRRFRSRPFPDVEASLKEIEYALDTLKLDGLIMLASIGGNYQGQPEFEEIYAELNRRKAVVFIHPTTHPSSKQTGLNLPQPLVEFLFDTTRAVTNLIFKGVLERYPDIRFILSHAGGTVPYIAYRLEAGDTIDPRLKGAIPHPPSYYLKRLYYDTALSASPMVLAALKQLVPPTQILFGSDWPFAIEKLTEQSVANLEGTDVIDANDKRRIDNQNALALFPRLRQHISN